MELRSYLAILRKYWVSILLFTIAGGLLAGIYVAAATPVYTAKSGVFLAITGGGSVSDMLTGTNYVNAQARSYAEIVRTPAVLTPTIETLGLSTTAAALAGHVTTTVPTNTSIIQIQVTDNNAARSAQIAQAVAESLTEAVKTLSPMDQNQNASIRATVITPATVPTAQTSPQVTLSLALGLIAGLVVGIILAVLRKVLDLTIRTEDDLKSVTGHSIIASIPLSSETARHPLVMQSAPQSIAAEEFRRLRTNLQFLSLGSTQRKVFLVTSSVGGEGKSTTAINIASALAEAGEKTLLLDADLRRPMIANYLNLEGSVGLTSVLLGRSELSDVIQSLGPGAPDILPLGQVPPNPSELAGSKAMWTVIDQVARVYNTVIIDSAPLCPVTDTAILSAFTTGAIVVAASGKVRRPQLQDALESLDHISTPVMGIVLNQLRRRSGKSQYYYYYGSTGSTKNTKKRNQPRRQSLPDQSADGSTWVRRG